MIIIVGILAVSIVLIILAFLHFISKLIIANQLREWELQERIREPSVEVMPPNIIKDQTLDVINNKSDFEFKSDNDDEYDLVGKIADEIPSRNNS